LATTWLADVLVEVRAERLIEAGVVRDGRPVTRRGSVTSASRSASERRDSGESSKRRPAARQRTLAPRSASGARVAEMEEREEQVLRGVCGAAPGLIEGGARAAACP
jgi:hypothetical protein